MAAVGSSTILALPLPRGFPRQPGHYSSARLRSSPQASSSRRFSLLRRSPPVGLHPGRVCTQPELLPSSFLGESFSVGQTEPHLECSRMSHGVRAAAQNTTTDSQCSNYRNTAAASGMNAVILFYPSSNTNPAIKSTFITLADSYANICCLYATIQNLPSTSSQLGVSTAQNAIFVGCKPANQGPTEKKTITDQATLNAFLASYDV